MVNVNSFKGGISIYGHRVRTSASQGFRLAVRTRLQ